MAKQKKKKEVWTCPDCCGSNVQMLQWIDPNTGEIVGGNEDSETEEHYYCNECAGHPSQPLVTS